MMMMIAVILFMVLLDKGDSPNWVLCSDPQHISYS